ncbi:MAG: SatD family protein [Saprospiraceae bacterium]|nr:SatD family protein [Saprospiraceae bacterium]
MVAVITGDIIHSQKGDLSQWMEALKSALDQNDPEQGRWEIYRGDSFQLVVQPCLALISALSIKAGIRQTGIQDVRMAIGIGPIEYPAAKISESHGKAFVRSGECFDQLKKETLAIRSGQDEFDNPINLMLSLASLTTDHWSPVVALVIQTALRHPDLNQQALARTLQKSQSSISEALKRGGYDPLMNLNAYFQAQLKCI